VHAYDATAFPAGPSRFFFFKKSLQADPLDIVEVLDHAQVVRRAVSVVEVLQFAAGKIAAGVAKAAGVSAEEFTAFDLARRPADEFVRIVHAAAGARILLAQMRTAHTAVDAAGRDQKRFGDWHDDTYFLFASAAPTRIAMTGITM
jgi:hypothetical protein